MAQHLPPDAPVTPLTDCVRIRMHLDAFVDGELADVDALDRSLPQLVGGHLRACERCARLERQLHGQRAALRAVGRREQATLRASDALRRRAAQILSVR